MARPVPGRAAAALGAAGGVATRVLAVVVLSVAVAGLPACGSGGDDVDGTHVGLAELVDHQEDHDGARVATSGVVRRFDDIGGEYHVIEDDDHNRVRVEPDGRFAPLVGQEVVVTGVFDYDEDTGRTITVGEVHPPT